MAQFHYGLSSLSEEIQEANTTLADVWNELEWGLATLEKYKSRNNNLIE